MAVIHLHKINSLDNLNHPSDFADGFLSVLYQDAKGINIVDEIISGGALLWKNKLDPSYNNH
jgi:hypothetical protein